MHKKHTHHKAIDLMTVSTCQFLVFQMPHVFKALTYTKINTGCDKSGREEKSIQTYVLALSMVESSETFCE